MKRISLPREHGAPLTLLGAATASALIAPAPVAAIGVELAILMAVLARGPLERKAPARPWDRRALVSMAVLGAGGIFLAAGGRAAGAAAATAIALIVPGASFLLRRRRWLHDASIELVAMLALGASAGLAGWCGGLAGDRAMVLAVLIGAHAAASVPLVRAQVRRREKPHVGVAMLIVAVAVVALLTVSRPLALLALAPRTLDIGFAAGRSAGRVDPRTVGIRETVLLVVAALTAAVTIS